MSEQSENQTSTIEYFLFIKLKQGNTPDVDWYFPPEDKDCPIEAKTVLPFCFPEEDPSAFSKSSMFSKKLAQTLFSRGSISSENFMFVLTDVVGSKRYGYVRRYPGKGSGAEPAAICFVSLIHSVPFFEQIFDIIEEKLLFDSIKIIKFLSVLYDEIAPLPGASLSFKYKFSDVYEYYTLERPGSETIPDFSSMSTFFAIVPFNHIIQLLLMVLTETRIVIVSKKLFNVSATINALSSLIFPFVWQHVFIPILPKSMIDYLSAPMPFLIGCLQSSWEYALTQELHFEEIVVYDLDSSAFIYSPESTHFEFPLHSEAILRNVLSTRKVNSSNMRKETVRSKGAETFNSHVQQCIGLFMSILMKGYENCFSNSKQLLKQRNTTKPYVFNTEMFVSLYSNDKEFYTAFSSSQLFFMYMSTLEDYYAKKELTEKSYFSRTFNVKLRTLENYFVNTPIRCVVCSKMIEKSDPCVSFNIQFYHSWCFRCTECSSLLEGNSVTSLHCTGGCAKKNISGDIPKQESRASSKTTSQPDNIEFVISAPQNAQHVYHLSKTSLMQSNDAALARRKEESFEFVTPDQKANPQAQSFMSSPNLKDEKGKKKKERKAESAKDSSKLKPTKKHHDRIIIITKKSHKQKQDSTTSKEKVKERHSLDDDSYRQQSDKPPSGIVSQRLSLFAGVEQAPAHSRRISGITRQPLFSPGIVAQRRATFTQTSVTTISNPKPPVVASVVVAEKVKQFENI